MASKRNTWRGFAVLLCEDGSVARDRFSYAAAFYETRQQAEARVQVSAVRSKVVRAEVRLFSGLRGRNGRGNSIGSAS